MKRRALLRTAGALSLTRVPLARAQPQSARTLRFVPQADLRVLDPVWTTAYVTRNFAYMVYDTLLAIDQNQRVCPQMVDAWTIAEDGLSCRFQLRGGLAFHDGQPVRPADCIASLRRWGLRDQTGQRLFAVLKSIEPDGTDAFVITLHKPFPQLLACIATIPGNPFVMPERVIGTDPNKQITEALGSGPFMFAREEWLPGQKAVFLRNPHYVPRSEPAGGSAGGKIAKVDRIEWLVLPDPATAAAALTAGEIDWWGYPTPDLVPLLQGTRNVTVKPTDPGGVMGILRFNCVQPPFDNVLVRRAVAMGVDRADYLQVMGGDRRFWVECDSAFPCSPASLPARRPDLEGARKLLRTSGYAGEKVVLLSAGDQTIVALQAEVTADLLRKIGMTVEVQQFDTATILSRRISKAPVSQGGWSIFHTWFESANLQDPTVNPTLDADGDRSWFGWLTDAPTETLIEQWYAASTDRDRQAIMTALDRRIAETVPFIITGQFLAPTAYRSGISGFVEAPALFFWNVAKA
jgi:peptide/nickel transport system substrate-binding protein